MLTRKTCTARHVNHDLRGSPCGRPLVSGTSTVVYILALPKKKMYGKIGSNTIPSYRVTDACYL
jgi:hypothetical protein